MLSHEDGHNHCLKISVAEFSDATCEIAVLSLSFFATDFSPLINIKPTI